MSKFQVFLVISSIAMIPNNASATGSDYNHSSSDNLLLNHHDHSNLQQSMAVTSPDESDSDALDRFFNFDNHEPVGHNRDHQLPWTIGSNGRWPPQNMPMMGLGHDPYHHTGHPSRHQSWPLLPQPVMGQPSDHDYHHAEHPNQHQSWPLLPQPVMGQPLDHDYHHAGHLSQHQSWPLPQPVMGQPSDHGNHQLQPQWAQHPNLQPEVIRTFSAVWPREWPSQDQHFASNNNPMLVPDSGPSPSGSVVTGPGPTQPMIPMSQVPVAPQRDRSSHIAKVSTRASRRRLQAKSGVDLERGDEKATRTFSFVPLNSGDVILACREEMKNCYYGKEFLGSCSQQAVGYSLPNIRSKETSNQLKIAELRNWAHNFRSSQQNNLGNVVDSICSDMKDVARLFVYFRYDLQTYQMSVPHLMSRGTRVEYLTADHSRFLDVTVTINGQTVTILFGNQAVMAYLGYLLYDSRYQYHRYIDGDYTGPSPGGHGTLFRWALEERRTGTVVDSELWVKNNREYHQTLVERFDGMTPQQKAALQTLVDQIATWPLN
ncbi:hypothetical protein F4604DRAFT_1683072 [Suillus subluteus]|nr:hypothetical protein F4604DRAFT_1683072 [Suillus subluteus]